MQNDFDKLTIADNNDTAPGCDPCQPFFRGKVRGIREGLGLGLYICSEIAKAHGGAMSVSSESGTTSFILRMPTQS
jgi:signal transduction histidine kinase